MNREGERGIVLLAVLLAVALMSVTVVAVTALTRSGISSQRLDDRLLLTRVGLRSGIESAKALIAATPGEQRVLFNGTPVVLDVGQGILAEITIRDAAGLADVNRSDPKFLSQFLERTLKPDVAKSLVAQLTDMRKKAEAPPGGTASQAKPSTDAKRPPAGEQRSLTTMDQGQPQPDAPEEKTKPLPVLFLTVDQMLSLVPPDAIDDAQARAVFAGLTVFNPTGRVNPFAAPNPVLQAVPGVSPQDIGTIDAARQNRALKGSGALKQILERLKPFVAVEEPSVFMIGVRLMDGPGVIAQSSAGAVVQLTNSGPLPFRTLSLSGL